MKKCFQSGAGRREEAESGTFTAAALQCWLCLIRAAVKLGLEITRGNTPTVFTAGSQQRNSQLSIIAPSEECSIKRRFFYLIETGHFSDSDMTSVSVISQPGPGRVSSPQFIFQSWVCRAGRGHGANDDCKSLVVFQAVSGSQISSRPVTGGQSVSVFGVLFTAGCKLCSPD